jgi:hypothetical protein
MRDVDQPPRVYLAGNIAYGCHWRSLIVQGVHALDDTLATCCRPFSFNDVEDALDPKAAIPVHASEGPVDIIGPFFVSCDHGCAHGWNTHAVGGGCINGGLTLAERDAIQDRVYAVNVARIKRADFVFAHINEVDCFGTIAEIGLAYGARVPVHLFFGEALTLAQRYDFWFVAKFAAHVHERISVNHAFARALAIHDSQSHARSPVMIGRR